LAPFTFYLTPTIKRLITPGQLNANWFTITNQLLKSFPHQSTDQLLHTSATVSVQTNWNCFLNY